MTVYDWIGVSLVVLELITGLAVLLWVVITSQDELP